MARAVYIGGFGGNHLTADEVARAAVDDGYYGDVDRFTFGYAMDNPDRIRRAVDGVDVITHSAGMLALRGTMPDTIAAFNAPVPTPVSRLVSRTFLKMARMWTPGIGIKSPRQLAEATQLTMDSMIEMGTHPKANLRYLPEITRFNGPELAADFSSWGVATDLVYTDNDTYFQMPSGVEPMLDNARVGLVRLPGEHDELVLRPERVLRAYFEAREAPPARPSLSF